MQTISTLCTVKLDFIRESGPSQVCFTECTQPSDSLLVVTNVLPFQVLLNCSGSANSSCYKSNNETSQKKKPTTKLYFLTEKVNW